MLIRSLLCCLLLAGSVHAQEVEPKKSEGPELKTAQQKASYLIGHNIGSDIKQQGLDVDAKALFAGIADALAGHDRRLTQEEAEAAFAEFRAAMMKARDEKAAASLEAGRKFLEANKSREGVKTTKSGLQYIVLKEGSGTAPTTDNSVTTHYRGTRIDGTVFDSSYAGDAPTAEEKPVEFALTEVIAAWTEALQMMKPGGKLRLFVPTELAYGEDGFQSIEPNTALIFELELISVK